MLTLIHIVFIFITLTKCSFGLTEQAWWETASFYQIYPRSFQDTDGDGVGDIKGVTQRLAYLKDIGITATWLSPIMTSPMADFGYDISDFYGIDPLFGTMEDFDEMVAEANKIGLKIIMDFVPNHTSDESEWFIKSVAGDSEYKDYYVWHPGKIVNGTRQPPTNWISVFRGSMWEWNDQRQAYYLHQFHKKQPDLNFRNRKVIEEMKNVIRFWLRKGIAGLRIDAVPHIVEVKPFANGSLPDLPRDYTVYDLEDYYSQLHIYTKNQPETIDILYEFRQVVEEMELELQTQDLVIMAEAYISLDVLMKYYGNATQEGAQIPFNTEVIVNIERSSNASDYKRVIETWMDNMPEGRTANWMTGNHDRKRVGTRLAVERIDMMNILIAVLPGCTITYYGEEIGMTDVWISWNNTVDPQACRGNEKVYERLSRDPARTPLQWSEEKNAGFTNSTPWLPIASNSSLVNVKNQRATPRSHLNIFIELRTLRQNPTFERGDLQIETPNENLLIIKRSLEGYSTYITILNINNNNEVVDLQSLFPNISSELTYELVTDKSSKRIGDQTSSQKIHLMPNECVILKSLS